jgi:hypothetical protein
MFASIWQVWCSSWLVVVAFWTITTKDPSLQNLSIPILPFLSDARGWKGVLYIFHHSKWTMILLYLVAVCCLWVGDIFVTCSLLARGDIPVQIVLFCQRIGVDGKILGPACISWLFIGPTCNSWFTYWTFHCHSKDGNWVLVGYT